MNEQKNLKAPGIVEKILSDCVDLTYTLSTNEWERRWQQTVLPTLGAVA